MATSKTTDTPESFTVGLKNLIPEVAKLMATPGATIKFCQSLMMVVAGKLKQGSMHQQSAMGAVAGVGGAGAGGAMGSPGTKPPGMSMPGGPAGGGAINPQMPNLAAPHGNLMSGSPTPTPDELRRVIAQTAGS